METEPPPQRSVATGWILFAAMVAVLNLGYTLVAYREVNELAAYCFQLGGEEPWPGCLEAGGRLQYNATFLLPFVINGVFAMIGLIAVIARFVSWRNRRRIAPM
jgi:hypothetical protein